MSNHPSSETRSTMGDVIATLMRLVVEVSGGDVLPNPGDTGRIPSVDSASIR